MSVPIRSCRTLNVSNVEADLNDGLSVPFRIRFITMAMR